jgi:hypothetical protein
MARVAMVVTNACAPDPRVERQAAWLADAGHEVIVHAFDRLEAHPTETRGSGWHIRRHRMGTQASGVSFATLLGLRRFRSSVLKVLRTERPDLVVLHDADTLPLATSVRRFGAKVVFDMHDLRHTWVLLGRPRSGPRRLASWWLEQHTARLLKHTDLCVTSSHRLRDGGAPGLSAWLTARGRSPVVLENRPEREGRQSTAPSDVWRVACLGRVRDTATASLLLKALATMPPEERPALRWAGDGVASEDARHLLRSGCNDLGVDLDLHGPFGNEDLDDLHDGVNVAVAMYDPARGNIRDGALPVRMFEAGCRGVPSVVNAEALMGEVAEHTGLGTAVQWGHPEALAEALRSARTRRVDPTAALLPETERKAWLSAMNALVSSGS